MAELVLGIGISHTPQMSMGSEHWANYASRDATAFPLIWRGQTWQYDDLVVARAHEGIAEQVNDEVWARKSAEINGAVDELASALRQAEVDVAIVIGDDHHELFTEDSMPQLAVYWGEELHAFRPDWVFPAVEPAAWALFGDGPETYPCHSGLARHLIESATRAEFDVAHVRAAPEGKSAGHPFILVRQRLMRGFAPTPIVPVVLNTYFSPNVPLPIRSWKFGAAIAAAIAEYPEPLRVAVIASGGLSHFVIDEAIDRRMLDALATGEPGPIVDLDPADFVSGTSENLCWIAAGGACAEMEMRVLAYVPGYRTVAGTGTAMTAAMWTPR